MTTNFYLKCFLFFLKKQGMYNNFILYFNQPQNTHWRIQCNYGTKLFDVIEMDYELVIARSFQWKDTKEGFEYWEILCNKWKKTIRKFHCEKAAYQYEKALKENKYNSKEIWHVETLM